MKAIKSAMHWIKRHKAKAILWLMIVLYIGYFGYSSVLRFATLYSSYFDLGIMHQTTYNSFQAIKNLDFSRFLELTNPFGPEQIKRMAIHNDVILGLLGLFYFVYSGPETLLAIQALVVGLGAWAVFRISQIVFEKNRLRDILALGFSFCYLLYPPLERANLFDFHAVVLATTFLLLMYYYWLIGKNKLGFLFFILVLLTKEQVALTTMFFGGFIFYQALKKRASVIYPLVIILVSIVWFGLVNFLIIPHFRGDVHFALKYYGDVTDNPGKALTKYILSFEALKYLDSLLGPLAFISILSPLHLLIALPELAINMLSNNINMRNIYYHYTAVITPFVFIAAIYGVQNLSNMKHQILRIKNSNQIFKIALLIMLISTLIFAYLEGPLPGAKNQEVHPFVWPQIESVDVRLWARVLKNEKYKISTTGKLAAFFTSRRYFYNFSKYYNLADYVVLRPNEIYNYPEKDQLIPVYQQLKRDKNFELIYKKDNFEVYKKI